MPNVLTISFRGSTTVRECQCVGCQILCLHWWAQRYVPTYQFRLHTNIKSQLYAALHEWRSGVHHATDFSTDAYMDAYDGHTGTLTHLRTERPRAYQVMMTELYDLARCVTLVLYYDHRWEIAAVPQSESPLRVRSLPLIWTILMVNYMHLVFNKPSSNMAVRKSQCSMFPHVTHLRVVNNAITIPFFQNIKAAFASLSLVYGFEYSEYPGQWSCTT